MADATPSRLGFIDKSSDGSFAEDNALFLKVFSGEVLAAFRRSNIMMGLTRVRTIAHGKSAQFPVAGKASATRHTPGDQLLGTQKIGHGEKIINIDDVLVADTFIASIDEAKNHYDIRSIYTDELGQAISVTLDKQLLQLSVLAARASANLTGLSGGSVVKNTSAGSDASVLAGLIEDAKVALEEKDIEETPTGVFRPVQYHMLASNPDSINTDYRGQGSVATGTIRQLHGVNLVRSNNVPSTDISANDGENNTYDGDFTDTLGSIFARDVVGTVQLMGMMTEMEYQMSRQGTLVISKVANGSGILRPECGVEVSKAA